MYVVYKNKKLENLLNDEKQINKTLEADAKRCMMVLRAIDAAITLSDINSVPKFRLHDLKGNRYGEYAIDINKTSGKRLIIKPLENDNNIMESNDYNYIMKNCRRIIIMEVSSHYEK